MTERAGGSRRLPASAWVFDSALSLVAAGLATALFASMPVGSGMLVLGYGLVLLHTLPLAARRRFPGTVLALIVASGLAGAALFLPPFFLGPAILVAVYSVAAYGSRWVSVAGLALAEVGLAAAVQLTPLKLETDSLVGFMGILAAAWLLGHFAHNYRAYAARLEERTTELERAREELARRAVTEERLRLARELHDVVAHAMSVIAVQSGVGAHVADSRPEEVGKALAAIEATSRDALTELRRLLGVLRQDGESQASLAPAPGLANLRSLVAGAGGDGFEVRPQHVVVGVRVALVGEHLDHVVRVGDRVDDWGRGLGGRVDDRGGRVGHGHVHPGAGCHTCVPDLRVPGYRYWRSRAPAC